MAFECFAGNFTEPGSTGNQSYTSVGFRPKAILFFTSNATADEQDTDGTIRTCVGFAAGASAERVIGFNDVDGVGTSDCNRLVGPTACVGRMASSAAAFSALADLVSFDADGFTLNWTVSSASSARFGYLALGGDDLTDAAIIPVQSPSSTGNQAYTAVGFQPDFLMMLSSFRTTTDGGTDAFTALGVADPTNEWCVTSFSEHNVGTSNTHRILDEGNVVNWDRPDNSALSCVASWVSMDADGFTLNWSNVRDSGTQPTGYALCLRGGQYAVGRDVQRTSTGTQATTGVGFTPTGLLFASVGLVASGSPRSGDDAMYAIGLSDGSNDKSMCNWSEDAVGTTATTRTQSISTALRFRTGAAGTNHAIAGVDSLDGDGFTLDWTTADATAREFGFVAFGSDAAAAGNPWHQYQQQRAAA